MGKTVMCLLTDPEGTHLGSAMYIPQNAGPLQLTQLVNKFLDNVTIFSLILTFSESKEVIFRFWVVEDFQELNASVFLVFI